MKNKLTFLKGGTLRHNSQPFVPGKTLRHNAPNFVPVQPFVPSGNNNTTRQQIMSNN